MRFARANWRGPANRTRTDEIVYVFKPTVMAPGLNAYRLAVHKAIGQRWYAIMNASYREVHAGVVRFGFLITPAGKVKTLRVLAGQAQQRLASLSAAALLDANIPPMSAAVRAALPASGRGGLECTFNFEMKP